MLPSIGGRSSNLNPVLKDILQRTDSKQKLADEQVYQNSFVMNSARKRYISKRQNELVNKNTISYYTDEAFKVVELKDKMKIYKENQIYFKQ